MNKQLLLSGVGGVAILALDTFIFPFGHLLNAIVGLGLAGATSYGLLQITNIPKKIERVIEETIDQRNVREAVDLAQNKLNQIQASLTNIRSPNTTRRIRSILEIGNKIVDDFKADPKDIPLARTWLHSYLDQTIDIVSKYAVLSHSGAGNAKAQALLAEFEDMLDVIERTFEKQLKSLIENDIMDLDIDMEAMRRMIHSEQGIS